MNPQEIFDKVCTHLMTQRKQSLNAKGCAYRGEDGTMCAVGCLISDADYKKEMEGKNVMGLITDFTSVPVWFRFNEDLLMNLQRCHDIFLKDGIKSCANKLAVIARMHKFILPEIVAKEL